MEKVAVLYFGSRGAGINFFNFTIDVLRSKNFEFATISKIEINFSNNLRLVVKIPRKKLLLYFGYKRRKTLHNVLKFLKENMITTVVIPMAHPWDLKLQKDLEAHLIKIIRIVHDGKTHLGEYFPSARDIEVMESATQVIVLSEHVSRQLQRVRNPVIVATHPIFEKRAKSDIPKLKGLNFSYDLIIGRHKRYQGTNRAIRWWCGLPDNSRKDSFLLIAGKINFLTFARYRFTRRIVFIRKWLNDFEYESLIFHANKILCLYQEASQSGVIASSRGFDRPVLATDVGGLPEQIQKYQNGICVPNKQIDLWEFGYVSLNDFSITPLNSSNDFTLENALEAVVTSL